MEADNVTSIPVSDDAEWRARHARLDAALKAAIRAPVVDERFAERVWARVRVDEAQAIAIQRALRTRLGTPWWLASLNVIAVAASTVIVALALSGAVGQPLAESAVAAATFIAQPSDAVRVGVTLLLGVAGLWFGLRLVPFARAFGRAWL
jgi:hypothetical protein